jgi:MFS family permease
VTEPHPAPVSRFAALQVRNFRLFFVGQFISVIGNWMQIVALAALVLDRLDRSATVLGLVNAMLYVPVIILGPFGGLATDRFSKWRLVLSTQIAFALAVGALGVLVVTDHVTLTAVLALAAAQGAINAFDNPARQTFVHEMVGGELLTNAVGLNMLAMNTARVIGPAIAGVLLATTDVGTLFVLNSLSFLGAIVALLCMRRRDLRPSRRVSLEKGQIRAGLAYARSEPTIRTALAMLVVVGGLAYNFPIVLPLLAKQTFHMAEESYGTFFSVMGIGAIIFALAKSTTAVPTPRRLAIGTAGLGLSLVALSLAPTKLVAYLVLPFLGAASLNFLVLMNSTLQLSSSSEMRGRVMALYTMALLGTTPVGALLVGWIGEEVGARAAIAVGGVAAILAAQWAHRHFVHNAAQASAAPA